MAANEVSQLLVSAGSLLELKRFFFARLQGLKPIDKQGQFHLGIAGDL